MAAGSPETTWLYQVEDCTGTLIWGTHRLDVSFSLTCSHTGEVTIVLDRILSSPETSFLRERFWRPDRDLSLRGTSPDGRTITTDAAFFTRWGSSFDQAIGEYFDLRMGSAELTVAQPPPESGPWPEGAIQYWIPGVRSFGPVSADSSLGTFWLKAFHDAREVEVLDSQLLLTNTQTDLMGVEAADRAADRILRVLSLAQGRSITWSVRQVARGAEGLEILFRGANRTTKPDFPLMPDLELRPMMAAAVRYAEMPDGSTGLDRAIGWMVMNPQFTEGALVTGMVSLESLLARHLSAEESQILPAAGYRRLSRSLRRVIREEPGVTPEAADQLSEHLGDAFNSISLRRKLELFSSRLDVHLQDLLPGAGQLVAARNQLVHSGRLREEETLDDRAMVLRELLSRVVLALLEYRGPYISYLPEYDVRQFPLPSDDQGAT